MRRRAASPIPAINVTSSITVNAALRGFAEAGSDGILQASTGGAEFASGTNVKDMVTGAVALAEFTKVVADKYGITVALHTDHCPKDKLDTYVKPLIAISTERVKAGGLPLFQSHMWDGSAVPLDENLKIAEELLQLTKAANIILEIEVGVVGGEEDGVVAEINEKLYTSPDDFIATLDALGLPEHNSYIVAATFGNVHGVYKPGGVKLRPSVLQDGQDALVAKLGLPAGSKPFSLVFHGGSGSSPEEIAEAVSYGVIKMNIDTDTQYAFTRPLADHFFKQLRRGAQGRRRGRQQEGLRPPRLQQARRDRHGRPDRRGLPAAGLGRQVAVVLTRSLSPAGVTDRPASRLLRHRRSGADKCDCSRECSRVHGACIVQVSTGPTRSRVLRRPRWHPQRGGDCCAGSVPSRASRATPSTCWCRCAAGPLAACAPSASGGQDRPDDHQRETDRHADGERLISSRTPRVMATAGLM